MKVLPYFHGHFGPLIKSIISSSIGDDIIPLVDVHATRALNNHPINSTIFFTCNLRFSNNNITRPRGGTTWFVTPQNGMPITFQTAQYPCWKYSSWSPPLELLDRCISAR